MTARELVDLIDKKGTLRVVDPGPAATGVGSARVAFDVYVVIINARENFGRIDVLVTPESGEGQAWVSADRVKVRGK